MVHEVPIFVFILLQTETAHPTHLVNLFNPLYGMHFKDSVPADSFCLYLFKKYSFTLKKNVKIRSEPKYTCIFICDHLALYKAKHNSYNY